MNGGRCFGVGLLAGLGVLSGLWLLLDPASLGVVSRVEVRPLSVKTEVVADDGVDAELRTREFFAREFSLVEKEEAGKKERDDEAEMLIKKNVEEQIEALQQEKVRAPDEEVKAGKK